MIHQIKMFAVFFVSATLLALTTEVNGPSGYIEGGKPIIVWVTFFSTILYALFIAQNDSQIQIKGVHYLQGAIRAGVMAFTPVILWVQQGETDNLLLVPLAYSTFYACFDQFYNHYRGENMFYIGRQALFDRVTWWINDHILGAIWPLWIIVVKVGCVIVSFYLLVKYYL